MVVAAEEILALVHQITVSLADLAAAVLVVEQVMVVQAVPLPHQVKETQGGLLLETFMEQPVVVARVAQGQVARVPQVVTRVVLVRLHL